MAKYIPREEYNSKYWIVTGSNDWIKKVFASEDPAKFALPRRYETINEVRKAALNKSKKNIERIRYAGERFLLTGVYVFKGSRFVGIVEYNLLKGNKDGIHDRYDGLWLPADNPKEPSTMLADGSLGIKPARRK